jgi:excisionase family DNA binding protein
MHNDLDQNEWLSVEELVGWLGCGRTRAYQLLRSGEIPSYRWGRRWLIRRRDVEVWLEANRYVPGNKR